MATEKRLIDANEALEKIKVLPDLQHFAEWYVHYDGVYNVLENAPTVDAVEVVRCKDCKHSGVAEYTGKRYCKYPMGCLGCTPTEPDNFCSYGERKDNE